MSRNQSKAVMRIVNGDFKLEKDTLKQIVLKQLDNIYCVKKELIKVLPAVADKASFTDLKDAIVANTEAIKMQILCMEVVYKLLKEKYNPRNANGVKRFAIDTCAKLAENTEQSLTHDLELLVQLQIIESLEIAYFDVLKKLAAAIGHKEVETMLNQNFDTSVSCKRLYELISNEYLN